MKSQQNAIKVLCVTALVLLAAVLFVPSPSRGEDAIMNRDGDVLVATYPSNNGNDALYIADTGKDAFLVLVWDNTARALQPTAVKRLSDGFRE